MNILFIGGTGNISTDCAALLHQRGHCILVLTRGRNPVPQQYTSLTADRHDLSAMRRLLQEHPIDVVINFLGYTTAEIQLDYGLFAGKIQQYIFISSATVYAKPHVKLPLTEESPVGNRFSEYAQNKLACEQWLLSRFGDSRFPVTIIRPSHTYCHRWIPNTVNSTNYTMVARLEQGKPVFVHDDGQNLWTLTATTDFAVALAGLVGNDAAIGEIFHITSDEVLTWNQIYAEVCRAAGIEQPKILRIPSDFIGQIIPNMIGKLKGDKAEHGVFDNAKIKRAVPDFACRKSFRQGMEEAIAWFRQDSARMQIDPETDVVFEQVTSAWRQKGG